MLTDAIAMGASDAIPAPPLFAAADLRRHYVTSGGPRGAKRLTRAVDGVSFDIHAGATLALVGESGCGKSTTARLILLLEEVTDGRIYFEGEEVRRADKEQLRQYRRSVQAVFQDPFSSLDPRMRVRDLIAEPLLIHQRLSASAIEDRVARLLDQVGLSKSAATKYPHQFSGGQRQRIAIARAISLDPKLIILDEPVSALDVSIRAQILNLLVDLQRDRGLAYLLISHDLAVVEHMSHHVAVMYAGRIVENAPNSRLYELPVHPYTRALLNAVPSLDPDVKSPSIRGEVADPSDLPPGCSFHPRCDRYLALGSPEVCRETTPALELHPSGRAACHFAAEASALPAPTENGRR